MASRSELTTRTRALLNNRPRSLTLPQIGAAVGLSTSWLSQFGRGLIPGSPGAVQRLHDHLRGR